MPPPVTNHKKQNRSNSSYLLQYAGMGMQLLAAIGIALFLGLKADGWLQLNFPLLAWLLPVTVLAGILYRILKDTSAKK